jgi:hypothetical protein
VSGFRGLLSFKPSVPRRRKPTKLPALGEYDEQGGVLAIGGGLRARGEGGLDGWYSGSVAITRTSAGEKST